MVRPPDEQPSEAAAAAARAVGAVRVLAPALVVAAVAVALLTQLVISRGWSVPIPGAGFIVAAALLGAAMYVDRRRDGGGATSDAPAWRLSALWEVGLLVAVIALAAWFRFYRFYSFPPGLWYDEAINAQDAISLIEKDHVRLWFETVFGRSTLYLYLLAASFKLFGYSLFAIRIVPTLAGLAAVVAFYPLARRLFGPAPALVATALLGVSRWAVTFSRISWEASIQPLIEILAVYCFVVALDAKGRAAWALFALAGFFLALGLYSYVAFRIVPVVVVVFFLLFALGGWRRVRARIPGLIVFVAAFVLVIAPLGIFTLRNTDKVTERTRQVSVFKEVDKAGSYDPLWNNVRATWRMFNVAGDRNGRHNLPFAPQVDDLTAAVFVLGLAASVFSLRNWRRGSLAPWLALSLVPGALTLQVENPSAIRDIGAIPPLFLLVGLTVALVQRMLTPVRWGGYVFAAASVALVGGATAMNYQQIFDRQANDPRVYDGFTPGFTQVARIAGAAANNEEVYVSRLYFGHPAFASLAHKKPLLPYTPSISLIVPSTGKDVLLIMDAGQFGALPTLQRLYPNLRREDYIDPFGKTFFSRITIPADDARALRELPVTVYGGADTSAPLVSRSTGSTQRTWTAQDIAAGPVTAVWEANVWIGTYPGLVDLTWSAPGPVSIELDGVASRGDAAVSVRADRLTPGEHRLRFTATITRPGDTNLTYSSNQSEAASGSMYGTSVGDRGFEAVFHAGRDFSGDPLVTARYPFAVAAGPVPGSSAVEYRAVYDAPVAGAYGFALEGTNGAQLFVDDALVTDNGGSHAARRVEGTVQLEAGPHTLSIQYLPVPQPDWALSLRVPGGDWQVLNGSEVSPPSTPYVKPALVSLLPDAALPGGRVAGADAPQGLAALSDGTLVVSSRNALIFFRSDGSVTRSVKLGDAAEIADIAVGAGDEIFALDRVAKAVTVLSADGRVLRTIDGPFASGAGIDVSGDSLYVASPAGGNLYRVPVSGGPPALLSVSAADAPVRAAQPADIAVGADGTVYINDFEKKALLIAPDGRTARSVPGVGGVGAQTPKLLVTGNLVLLSDPLNERILIFDRRGKQRGLYQFPSRMFGTRPVGMAVAGDGTLWVADTNGLIFHFSIVVPPELAPVLAQQ